MSKSPICWRVLEGSRKHAIDCRLTFLNGQCFSWKETDDGVFTRVLGQQHHLVSVRNRKEMEGIEFQLHTTAKPVTDTINGTGSSAATHDLVDVQRELGDHLQLSHDMVQLTEQWSRSGDPRLQVILKHLPGLRILRQDVVECLFSFICSSNNNIKRITQILDKLRQNYGTFVGQANGLDFFSFPEIDELAKATETELRNLGLGYRARFVGNSAQKLVERGGREYLEALREKDRETVIEELTSLEGVGRKVADCVALFCMDKADCIPVDTHVWAIACRELDPSLREAKSLTPKIYNYVGELFRQKYGNYCGWAHSLMFAAELQPFRKVLPSEMQQEMEKFAEEERQLKAARKRARESNQNDTEAPKSSITSKKTAKKSATAQASTKGTNSGNNANQYDTEAPKSSITSKKTAKKSATAQASTKVTNSGNSANQNDKNTMAHSSSKSTNAGDSSMKEKKKRNSSRPSRKASTE